MNLYLHGIEPKIELGDTIYEAPAVRPLRRGPHQSALRHQGSQPGAEPRRLHHRDQQQATELRPARPDDPQARRPGRRRRCRTTASLPIRPARCSRSCARTATCTRSCACRVARSRRTARASRPTSSSSPRATQRSTVWIYDARSNVPGITKKDRPLIARTLRRVREVLRRRSQRPGQTQGEGLPAERATWRRPLAVLLLGRGAGRATSSSTASSGSRTSLEDADELPPPEELADGCDQRTGGRGGGTERGAGAAGEWEWGEAMTRPGQRKLRHTETLRRGSLCPKAGIGPIREVTSTVPNVKPEFPSPSASSATFGSILHRQ